MQQPEISIHPLIGRLRSLDKWDAVVFDKGCYEKNVKRQCEKILQLFEFANKILSLYFLVLALWF